MLDDFEAQYKIHVENPEREKQEYQTHEARQANSDSMSLLSEAKKHTVRSRTTKPEEKELALGWMKDEVTNTQVAFALTGKANQTVALYRIAHALKDLYKEGKLNIK